MGSKTVTDATFEADVLRAPGLVLVDFWAEWCAPCRTISPALEEIGEELGERLTVAKVNVDDNPDTATRYGIRSIPTLMLFRDGQVAATRVGVAPKSAMRAWIDAEH